MKLNPLKKGQGKFLLSLVAAGGCGAFLAVAILNGTQSSSLANQVTTSKVTYNTETSTTEAVKKVQNAVVSVISYQTNTNTSELDSLYSQIFGQENSKSNSDQQEADISSEGSGVIYKKSGNEAYIVTNNHVISGAEKIEIMLSDGSKVVGQLVGADTYSDLAVVKISSDKVTSTAEFADSDKLNVGEPAIAIGSPLGSEYANSVTEGIVSSLSRTVTSQNEDGETISTNAIQTDAAINPGNSGGPLINIKGQVIGINSSKISASGSLTDSVSVEGMGFAIPSNDVVSIINQLEQNGSVERPALGITMLDLSQLSTTYLEKLSLPGEITTGVVVVNTQDNMPASGKLEANDVIVSIDGEEVTSISDLQSILYKHNIGDELEVTYYRGQEKKTAKIQLEKSTKDLQTTSSSN